MNAPCDPDTAQLLISPSTTPTMQPSSQLISTVSHLSALQKTLIVIICILLCIVTLLGVVIVRLCKASARNQASVTWRRNGDIITSAGLLDNNNNDVVRSDTRGQSCDTEPLRPNGCANTYDEEASVINSTITINYGD